MSSTSVTFYAWGGDSAKFGGLGNPSSAIMSGGNVGHAAVKVVISETEHPEVQMLVADLKKNRSPIKVTQKWDHIIENGESKTKMVYEFYFSFWPGDPEKQDKNTIQTMDEDRERERDAREFEVGALGSNLKQMTEQEGGLFSKDRQVFSGADKVFHINGLVELAKDAAEYYKNKALNLEKTLNENVEKLEEIQKADPNSKQIATLTYEIKKIQENQLPPAIEDAHLIASLIPSVDNESKFINDEIENEKKDQELMRGINLIEEKLVEVTNKIKKANSEDKENLIKSRDKLIKTQNEVLLDFNKSKSARANFHAKILEKLKDFYQYKISECLNELKKIQKTGIDPESLQQIENKLSQYRIALNTIDQSVSVGVKPDQEVNTIASIDGSKGYHAINIIKKMDELARSKTYDLYSSNCSEMALGAMLAGLSKDKRKELVKKTGASRSLFRTRVWILPSTPGSAQKKAATLSAKLSLLDYMKNDIKRVEDTDNLQAEVISVLFKQLFASISNSSENKILKEMLEAVSQYNINYKHNGDKGLYIDAVKRLLNDYNIILDSASISDLSYKLQLGDNVIDLSRPSFFKKAKDHIQIRTNSFFATLLRRMPKQAEKNMIRELFHIKALIHLYENHNGNSALIKNEIDSYQEKIKWYLAKENDFKLGIFEDRKMSKHLKSVYVETILANRDKFNQIWESRPLVVEPPISRLRKDSCK